MASEFEVSEQEIEEIANGDTVVLINRWADLRNDIEELTALCNEIKKQVEARGVVAAGNEAEVILTTAKGEYDWEGLSRSMKPTKEMILEFTYVQWNKLAERLIPDKKKLNVAKKDYHFPGVEIHQLRLKRKD